MLLNVFSVMHLCSFHNNRSINYSHDDDDDDDDDVQRRRRPPVNRRPSVQ